MDTSETYIKMCDCPEIQSQWKLQSGDWAREADGDIYAYTNHETCHSSEPQLVANWYGCHSDQGGDSYVNKDTKVDTLWLPRQDQVQGMLWGKLDNPIKKVREFTDFMEYWLWLDLDTIEQQLLAFYMHEKYKKIWNDVMGKWVKK